MKILVTEVRTYKKADAGYLLEGGGYQIQNGELQEGIAI